MLLAERRQRHLHARMPLHLPRAVRARALEGERRAHQPRDVQRLAQPPPPRPGRAHALRIGQAGGEHAVRLFVSDPARVPGERQQRLVPALAVRDDLLLAPRRLDAQLGGVGLAEQRAPIVRRGPPCRAQRRREPRRRHRRRRHRLLHRLARARVAHPGERGGLHEARPDRRVGQPAARRLGESRRAHRRDLGAQHMPADLQLAVAHRRPQPALARAIGQHVEVEHAVHRAGAQIGSVEQHRRRARRVGGERRGDAAHPRRHRRGERARDVAAKIHEAQGTTKESAGPGLTVSSPPGNSSPSRMKPRSSTTATSSGSQWW